MRGQLIGQLVQLRFSDAVAQNQSIVAAEQQVAARLHAGSCPEEIAEARADVRAAEANVAAAQANVKNAELLYRRQQTLARQQYVSLQVRDDAERAYLAQKANLAAAQQILAAKHQALRLAVIGPRKEDIAAAEATLRADHAPKNVETTELRSQLVYRVRVYACNPDHRLRLGMGLMISVLARSQFVAAMVAIVTTFLAGNLRSVILTNVLGLGVLCVVFLGLSVLRFRKRLD
jgi:hypothetical protein